MVEPSHKPLARSRTYARDLDEQRTKHGIAPGAVLHTSPQAKKAPVAAPKVMTVPKSETSLNDDDEIMNLSDRSKDHVKISEAVVKTRSDETFKEQKNTPTTIPTKESLKAPTSQNTSHSPRRKSEVTMIEDDSAATIITDTKTDRFHVTTSILSSLINWWQAEMKKRQKKKEPKYVVQGTERRKGIIQQATSQTARRATDDHGSIRDQVRLRETEIQKPTDHPTTVWTPNTEPVWPLLEDKHSPENPPAAVTSVSPEAVSGWGSDLPVPPVSTPVEELPPAEVTAWSDPVPPLPTPLPKEAPVEVTPPEPVTPTPPTPPAPSAPIVEVTEEETPAPNPTQNPAAPHSWQHYFSRVGTTGLTLITAVVIAILFIAVLFVRSLMGSDSTATVSSLLMNVPTYVVNTVPSTTAALHNGIESYRDLEQGTTVVIFATTTETNTPDSLLRLLDNQIDPNLGQSVTHMVFGWYQNSEPFIVLRVTDRATALGSMLKWENSMPNALFTLFSIPTTPDTSFSDGTVLGTDVRTLTSLSAEELIIYGFSNPQTIVITTNSATYAAIATLVTPVK